MQAVKRILCVFLFLLSVHAFAGQAETSVITINSAQSTEYVKDETTGDELILFEGGVSLTVKSGSSSVSISALSVTFNRKTEMLSANGSVTLTQSDGGSSVGETVYAQSLLFNTRTMEGVFDDARVFQTQGRGLNLPAGSTLVVNADLFGRDSSSTVAFKNGELTFCEDENPHWKIWASRIWLLPGQEFAFFNAVLSLGNVPVLYLPAFYYPKDELIFHPVFGYDNRLGYYFQTTTYLYGRKPLSASTKKTSSESSANDVMDGIFNFMKPTALKEQKREGLVLHNLETDFTGSTSEYIKLLADYYTSLGGMVGVDGVLTPSLKNINISKLAFHAYFGFSTTVFNLGSVYTQYAASGKVYYNTSSFMGIPIPFRYNAALEFEMSSPFKLALSIPIYSDPYFTADFASRSEDMDWFSFLMNSAQLTQSSLSSNELSSFEWSATASYTIPLPQILKPYLSDISISRLSSSVTFASKNDSSLSSEDSLSSYSPQRKFFYPSSVTPIKFTASISGTLFEYPAEQKQETVTSPSFVVPLDVPPELLPEEQKQSQQSSEEKTDSLFTFPLLTTKPDLSLASFQGLTYKLSYSLSPDAVMQVQYDASTLSCPQDFDWNNIQSMYVQLKAPLEFTSLLSYRSSFVSVKSTLAFVPQYQDHPFVGNGYSASSAQSVLLSDYKARKLDLTESNSVSLKPFVYSSFFKNSGLDWNTSFKLMRTQFNGTIANPSWQYLPLDFTDKESFTEHSVSATFAAQETEYLSQSLTLSTRLPPQEEQYRLSFKAAFPYVSTSLSTGIQHKSSGSNDWEWQPLQQSASVKLFSQTENALTFTETFNYNLQEEHAQSLRLALSWRTLSASFSMQYTYGYDFDSLNGWKARTQQEFLPVNVNLSYSLKAKEFRFWKNRITLTPSLSTSLVLDFLRPTSSYFTFAPTLSFSIHEFLDISFSAQSRNDVIYRYVQNLFPGTIHIPGETNPFVDLFNSFAFWGDGQFYDSNQTKRKSSGFKLKSLSVKVTHDLHDWRLSAELSVSPRLTTSGGQKRYSFDPYFTLSVIWKPLPSIKTQVTDDYGTLKIQ